MKRLHLVPEFNEASGVFQVARLLAEDETAGKLALCSAIPDDLATYDEVWVHGMWLPIEWGACLAVLKTRGRAGTSIKLVRMLHGSLSPVYLERQSKWKKRLVAPIERWLFAYCDRIVVTGDWEESWCRSWGLKGPFETVDLKRYFKLGVPAQATTSDPLPSSTAVAVQDGTINTQPASRPADQPNSSSVSFRHSVTPSSPTSRPADQPTNSSSVTPSSPCHLLYLGRRHPLKGLSLLEKALEQLNFHLPTSNTQYPTSNPQSSIPNPQSPIPSPQHPISFRAVSDAFGEEKEKVWDWCDVLVLPTLSENFGLVVAEALERGKRVLTTDGAPAWNPGECVTGRDVAPSTSAVGDGTQPLLAQNILEGYGGHLIYLTGYREGTDEQRVELLKQGIMRLC